MNEDLFIRKLGAAVGSGMTMLFGIPVVAAIILMLHEGIPQEHV